MLRVEDLEHLFGVRLPFSLRKPYRLAAIVADSAEWTDWQIRFYDSNDVQKLVESLVGLHDSILKAEEGIAPIRFQVEAGRKLQPFAYLGEYYPTAHEAALALGRSILHYADYAANPSVITLHASTDLSSWRQHYLKRFKNNEVMTAAGEAGCGWDAYRERYRELAPRFEVGELIAGLRLEAAALVAAAADIVAPSRNQSDLEGNPTPKGQPGRRGYPAEALAYAKALRLEHPNWKAVRLRNECLKKFSADDLPPDGESFRSWLNRKRTNRTN